MEEEAVTECQYNCPSMFESGRTVQMVGRTYQVKTRQRKRNKVRRKGEGRGEEDKRKEKEKKKLGSSI